jgi:hypothetical protein
MDVHDIFLLGNAHKRGALHVEPVEPINDPFDVARGRDLKKRVFRQLMGSRAYDWVGTTEAVLRLVSTRLVGILREAEVTGWTTYEVQVLSKRGDEFEGYHGFAVTGVCGPIDNSKSHRVWREPVVPGGEKHQVWLGFYPDLSAWDGSDVFGVPSTGYVFVTTRVKILLEKHKVTNVRFQRLTEVERLAL